ncbi:MAG: family 16 glycoside hydrolase [Opitutaceae bacterium]
MNTCLKRTFCVFATILISSQLYSDDGYQPLFNGTDLTGWRSILGEKNPDDNAFSVNAADQAIHVYAQEEPGSKQPIDCLYTDVEFSHFVLKMEYRWLDPRFEPRLTHDRDAGLLFHLHGDLTELWPNCVEMQLGESDVTKTKDRYATGDLWVIGKDIHVMNARGENDFYTPGSPLIPVGSDYKYDKSFIPEGNEKPHGEWNEITLTVRGGEGAIFELNGKEVNRVGSMSTIVDGQRVPLDHGRIGLQAEYAELQYRNIRIKELPVSEVITVDSLEALMPYLEQSHVRVKLAPGEYSVTAQEALDGKYTNPLFMFSGHHSHYDFTDVSLNVETGVMQAFGRADVHQIQVVGTHNVLKNLTLADDGSVNDAPTWRATNIVMDGAHNRIEGFHLTVKGSFPYGYGDLFGKGRDPVINHQKHCAILVRGDFNHLKDSTVIHRAYGHGIYAQGAYDCLIEGCYVEGEVRTTDDILAEAGTGSPADKVDFKTVMGNRVKPGYMISLQEDGIRSYGMANIYGGGKRDTRNMTVKNCTVNRMRSGVVMTHNSGERLAIGCTTINCEKGYSIGRGRIVNCRSDAKYGPAYRSDYSSDKDISVDLTILSNRDAYNGSGLLAYIAGSENVEINLHSDEIAADADLKIQVGGNAETKGHIGTKKSSQDNLKATGLVINNGTDYPIEMDARSSNCTVHSKGVVTDAGVDNTIKP